MEALQAATQAELDKIDTENPNIETSSLMTANPKPDFGRVSIHDGLCPFCDGLGIIIRPVLVLKKFSQYRGLRTIRGLQCPGCKPDEAFAEAESTRQEQIDEALSKAGVPRKFCGLNLDDFKAGPDLRQMGVEQKQVVLRTQWKANIESYVQALSQNIALGKGMSFFGSVGTGKTLAMGIIANAIVSAGHSVVFIPERGIFDAIKATFDDGTGITEREVIAQFANVTALMIDDYGVKAPSDWVSEIYHAIIDQRYDTQMPTFISSNNGMDTLAKMYPRQVDRLARNFHLVMVGESFRGGNVEQ